MLRPDFAPFAFFAVKSFFSSPAFLVAALPR